MQILVIVARDARNPLAAGGDHHITLLAKELVRAGHSVELWCGTHASLERSETDEGVQIRRLAPVRLLPLVVWSRQLFGDSKRFDVVVEDLIGGARVPFFSSLLSRRPHVGFWFQNNTLLFRTTFSPLLSTLAEAVQRLLLNLYRSGFVIVPSNQTKAWLRTCGYDSQRIAVYPRMEHIPDISRRPSSFGDRQNAFVCIGNIRPLKRLEEAVNVLARLRETIPDASLTIIGRQDDNAYLRRLRIRAEMPPVAGHVEILVNAPEREKFLRLAKSKAITLHSLVEGLGWTIIEAGACGTPAVGNTGVPEEILQDHVNGIRVPPQDITAYTNALCTLMSDADIWQQLSEGAYRVAETFTRPSMNREVGDLLERCVSASHRG